MLNTIADLDLDDHGGRRTQDNPSEITQTILDVEECMMSSKIAHLLKRLLKKKQSKCGPTKLIGIALSHNSIFSVQIDGTITAQAQEKALDNFINNTECKVLIESIATAGAGLNITCANIVYLIVRGPPKFYPNFPILTTTFPGAQLEPSH
ncbi:hypothetical protein O181_066519 [Austropuccinia psidii MF-1]|uniref:Helicase C-terminal domain-containing protein n=1 Tax=Austropuccinia psidii MF-1 TaxID=1389203 RepID=A0A9Q3ETL7_9BASI|nr:hypothetical protein [Austropuccinia psidii MF-1]